MKSRKKRLREVYVWELPVRIYHWVNALCIAILCVTGFIIADPPAIMSASVRILLQFRIPALLGIRRESLCQME